MSYSTNPTLANSCTEWSTKAPPIPSVVFISKQEFVNNLTII